MIESCRDWWSEAVADFGTNMGFRDTGNWSAHALNLSVDGGRYLVDVERTRDEVLLAVFRRAPLCQLEEKTDSLLRACSYESYQPFFIQAGLKGEETLVLTARLDKVEASRLYAAFELIRKLYANVGL